MRLYLLPISTRRTLIYCQRVNVANAENKSLVDKGVSRAAALWASWEKKDSGWQKKLVDYGNLALQRIAYEEWGLKSIPPIPKKLKNGDLEGVEKVDVAFPSTLIPQTSVLNVVKTLATERQDMHQKRLIWSIVGMPIVAPFALVPVIPNIPFFYLVYRAWSHWRALSGSKHVEFLLKNNLIVTQPSPILDALYAAKSPKFESEKQLEREVTKSESAADVNSLQTSSTSSTNRDGSEEVMVLEKWNARLIAKELQLPEVEIELERAIWQVENALKEKKEKSQSGEKK